MQEHWKLRPNEIYETVFKEKVKQGSISSMDCKGYDKQHNNVFCYTAYNNMTYTANCTEVIRKHLMRISSS